MNYISAFWNSPIGNNLNSGPKTTHFWGPMSNWGFVFQGFLERNRPAEKILRNM